ncbi:relaxase/mobilization nuclease domain-containing protein, partial [Priestia megaterium]|uniref:relaxase/mobilization nuclease domain-containing protein n=1 Tax=Priestia megaterium TaxID=1404 RepID=UPI00284F8172
MAIVKVVSSKASITNAIDYVTKKEKTNGKLVSGYNLNAKYAKEQMAITKKLWDKTGGRTYKHFVQSYHKDEKIDLEKAHELAYQFVERAELFKDFEVLIATHSDKEHIHTHFIVNSVNASTGKKFQMKKTDLDVLRNISDEICRKNGLTITKDGKSFEGEKRVSISAPTKETYRQLKKASEKKATSYLENIAKAIIELKEIAKSKIEFIELMKNKGFEVLWSDNKKNVTYVDLA